MKSNQVQHCFTHYTTHCLCDKPTNARDREYDMIFSRVLKSLCIDRTRKNKHMYILTMSKKVNQDFGPGTITL